MIDDENAGPNGHDVDMEEVEGEEQALAVAQTEAAALKDQLLRMAAEMENSKRRSEREANDARAYAIQKFARDLMGVADNLQRALQHAPREDADPAVKNLVVGLDMTQKELQQAFDRNGLKRVDPARGDKFDPNLHQAMMEQPADDVPPGSVLQVIQDGYELMGRLVRPAMVVVAAKGAGAKAEAAQAYAATQDSAGGALDTKA